MDEMRLPNLIFTTWRKKAYRHYSLIHQNIIFFKSKIVTFRSFLKLVNNL